MGLYYVRYHILKHGGNIQTKETNVFKTKEAAIKEKNRLKKIQYIIDAEVIKAQGGLIHREYGLFGA